MTTIAAVAVRERPMLFSGPMVRAILDGRKTQTRRVVTPQPNNPDVSGVSPVWGWGVHKANASLPGAKPGRFCLHAAFNVGGTRVDRFLPCPYGAPGDRLWVRETFFDHGNFGIDALDQIETPRDERIEYRAEPWDRKGEDKEAGGWTASIHMPRWASRITLEITNVRVQRVQEISESDAQAEGVEPDTSELVRWGPYKSSFAFLWQTLNAERAPWWSSPFVWVIEFTAVES